MKRLFSVMTLGLIVFAGVWLYRINHETIPAPTMPPEVVPTAVAFIDAPFGGFAIDQPRTIDFDADADSWNQLTARERLDQMRDWLLWAVVGDSGATADEVNRTLFDLSPVRRGYLHAVSNYEYGTTRLGALSTAALGDRQLVALLPVCEPGQRKELLAHVADDYVKNVGQRPLTIQAFDYQIDPKSRTATVWRRAPMTGETAFTPEYGSVESGRLTTLDGFHAFMTDANDVVSASVESDGIKLTGRHLADYRGIRDEEVAAVWQAERKIQTDHAAFEARWKQKEREFNDKWSARRLIPSPSPYPFGHSKVDDELAKLLKNSARFRRAVPKPDQPNDDVTKLLNSDTATDNQDDDFAKLLHKQVVTDDHDKEFAQLQADYNEEARHVLTVRGSGFSLDPTYDYAGLAARLKAQFTQDTTLTEAGIGRGEFDSVVASLLGSKPDIVPLLILIDRLKAREGFGAELVGDIMHRAERKYSFQAARYDGELKGTETGMVLFYTDLLAKLWAIDYLRDTPTTVADFHSMPDLLVSSIYHKEAEELSSTRLWFGTEDGGFSVGSEGGGTLRLARRATRL